MKKYYKTITWSSYDLPKVLKDRGVDDPDKLPGFHYRDDALRLWSAIEEYVTKILSIYYHSDEDIQKVCNLKLDFQSKYNLPTCPLKFYGLLSAIKSLWSKCKGLCNQNPKYESLLENVSKSKSASRLIYAKLISKKAIAPTQNQQKWIKDCNEDDKDLLKINLPASF